jgi:hypothetical protein
MSEKGFQSNFLKRHVSHSTSIIAQHLAKQNRQAARRRMKGEGRGVALHQEGAGKADMIIRERERAGRE